MDTCFSCGIGLSMPNFASSPSISNYHRSPLMQAKSATKLSRNSLPCFSAQVSVYFPEIVKTREGTRNLGSEFQERHLARKTEILKEGFGRRLHKGFYCRVHEKSGLKAANNKGRILSVDPIEEKKNDAQEKENNSYDGMPKIISEDFGDWQPMPNKGYTSVDFPAWARTSEEVANYFRVDVGQGLGESEVKVRREIYGWNELERPKGKDFLGLVIEQFDDALVQVLIAAAVVSFLLAFSDAKEGGGLEEFTEPLIIVAIVVLNAVIGVWQESRAEDSLEALKQMQSETASVIRNGKEILELPARELVPGDIVEIRAGDKVPADLRIFKLKSGIIRLTQSSLTGESQPVLKQIEKVDLEDIELQGKECMAFAGTTVSQGSCLGIVTETGMGTEIGKIQTQITEASIENYDTPLTRKLDEFSDLLTKVVGAICVSVWLINYKYFISWDASSGFPGNFEFDLNQATYYFKVAVALAVAAIPEGLPAVITTCLALGTQRMAKENAVVRRLPSVETLGCTTVICSDKTGTLTTNQMSVTEFAVPGVLPNGSLVRYTVKGNTYNPRDGKVENLSSLNANLQMMAQICAICNDASIVWKNGSYSATGMPTEAALKVLVEKLGVPDDERQRTIHSARRADPEENSLGACKYWTELNKKLFTLEFDRTRKSMSVIAKQQGLLNSLQGNRLFVKGASEFVLDRCSSVQCRDGIIMPMSSELRERISEEALSMTSRALRVLAMAVRVDLKELSTYDGDTHPSQSFLVNPENYTAVESDLTFVGLVGLQDPPRIEVKESIEDCKKAGIRVMVITGDNQKTAEAICRDIGLFGRDEDLRKKSFVGREFMNLPVAERQQILLAGSRNAEESSGFVFSRAEPRHKQEIVRMLQGGREVVAMTGDGVNDAPALKLADIGVAMGITGTEVAKEAADMILTDDDFATIVHAVREGRSIYDNMKAFIRYLISSNIGEVASILLTAVLGFPQGLIPVQLLWVNLVTDGLPATALGFNSPDADVMERPPRPTDESLISPWIFFRYLVIGGYVGFATVAVFAIWYLQADEFLGISLRDGHTAITFHQLTHWGECSLWGDFRPTPFTAGSQIISFDNPCDYFTVGKVKASTLAMSTLVVIEMFNALNALSENNSLLRTPPWANKWLLLAIGVSMAMHAAILYTPVSQAFQVVPLSPSEWALVVVMSAPVILIDEALKVVGRNFFTPKK